MLLTRGLAGIWDNVTAAAQLAPSSSAPYVPQSSASQQAATGTKTRAVILTMTQAYLAQLRARVAGQMAVLNQAAMSGQIQACPSMKMIYKGWACGSLGTTDNPRDLRVANQRYIEPIGIASILGLAISPLEIKKGNPTHPDEPTAEFDATLNSEQQFVIDRAAYVRSQVIIAATLYNVDISERTNINELLADPNVSTGFVGLFTRDVIVAQHAGSKYQTTSHVANPSLNQLISLYKAADNGPWLTLNVNGYSCNPIQAKDSELNEAGGALAYYQRGGYLLVRNCFIGKEPLEHSLLMVSTGICMQNCDGQTRPVVTRDLLGTSVGWLGYITISNGRYRVRVQPKEAGSGSKITSAIASILKGIAGLACVAAPMVAGYNTTLLKETCTDSATKKPCVKDAKNTKTCICIGPPLSQAAMVGVANAAITYTCGKLNQTTTTAIPPPPPMPADNTWYWILGGVAVAGVIYAARK